MIRRLGSACILSFIFANPVLSQPLTGTLQKIQDRNTISLGHRESSIPFSYYDDKQQVIGYSQDIANVIVNAIRERLHLPDLTVRFIPVTSQNRISLVQNGTVDIECGSTTNTAERQRQVAFSNSIFIVGTRLLTRKDSGIKDFPDLAGKNVVTTAGTTSERLLRKLNEDRKMGMNIVSAKDHGESFLTLERGSAVAFMMDDALLYGEMAKARMPGDWHVVGTSQSREAYGCMLRKDDPQFKAVVDTTIARLQTSGDVDRLYNKWFMSPTPPKGLNLKFPISDDVKALFKNPNDRSFDQIQETAGGKLPGYNWDWGIFLKVVPSGSATYLDWMISGLWMTVALSLSAWFIALILGAVMGVLRTAPNRWLSGLAASYVEVFRNIPLLVQLFIWYFVFPDLLPATIGNAIKQSNPAAQQFLASMICLGLFTGARVCDQVRSGIRSLPKDQKSAGLALGFTLPQTYRYIMLPMAFRLILPPLTSEFLNIFKNSAVCSTIGLLELAAMGRQLVDYTSQPYESFIAVTLLYLAINAVIMTLMRRVENRARVPGYIGGK